MLMSSIPSTSKTSKFMVIGGGAGSTTSSESSSRSGINSNTSNLINTSSSLNKSSHTNTTTNNSSSSGGSSNSGDLNGTLFSKSQPEKLNPINTTTTTSTSYAELERQLVQNMHSCSKVLSSLQKFVRNNLELKRSSNYKCKNTDSPNIILDVLDLHRDNEDIVTQSLKTLRILARKKQNRENVPIRLVQSISSILQENKDQNAEIASEGSNALLNICFEGRNISSLSKTNCVPALVELLVETQNKEVLLAAVGALQSITVQDVGRRMVKEANGVPKLCSLLKNDNKDVQKKTISTIHNLTSDIAVVQIIKDLDEIPTIISLLKQNSIAIASSAAGCLQNISRVDKAREVIQQNNGTSILTSAIFSTEDPTLQVNSIGALLNILGSSMNEKDVEQRKALKKILSMCLLVGQLKSMTDILEDDEDNLVLEDDED